MTSATPSDTSDSSPRLRPNFLAGLGAVVIYVLFAAVVSNLLTDGFKLSEAAADYALGHALVLVLVIAGVLFVRWAGWSSRVWRERPAYQETPPRRWLLVIPILLLTQSIALLIQAPWGSWQAGPALLALVVTALVGIGEELYFRGILRACLSAHHGQTVTLIVTSVFFGLAHSVGSFMSGEPVGFVIFQVAITALGGATLYASLLATGRLWVPMVLHFLSDFSLLIGGGKFGEGASDAATSGLNVGIQAVLMIATIPLLISCIRHDSRTRHHKS